MQPLAARGGPEVVALDDVPLRGGLAVHADDHRAALVAERRIGRFYVETLAQIGGQRVDHLDGHVLVRARICEMSEQQPASSHTHTRGGLHQLRIYASEAESARSLRKRLSTTLMRLGWPATMWLRLRLT